MAVWCSDGDVLSSKGTLPGVGWLPPLQSREGEAGVYRWGVLGRPLQMLKKQEQCVRNLRRD